MQEIILEGKKFNEVHGMGEMKLIKVMFRFSCSTLNLLYHNLFGSPMRKQEVEEEACLSRDATQIQDANDSTKTK
jgi:hypothetical protein